MPAIVANAPNFLLNSDYPLDKLVYVAQGSCSMGPYVDVNIPHGLPFIPNCLMQWSRTSDFAVTYDENTGPFPSGNPGYMFSLQVSSEATATNVILRGNGIITITIYYRIIAFEPNDSATTVAPTSSTSDNFLLNTDYNYTKLYLYDNVTLAAGASTSIAHNFGYLPQVLSWAVLSGTSYSGVYISYSNQNIMREITTTNLNITNNLTATAKVYYRIYIDA